MFSVPVVGLLKDERHRLKLRLVAGKAGLSKKITIPRIQKPGLALTGDATHLHPGRIQVLGEPELNYFSSLSSSEQTHVSRALCQRDIACFVVTNGARPPRPLVTACQARSIPLFSTTLLTSTFVNRATRYLDESLSAKTNVHGVLLDVFGVGILLIGKSGIGKSECALDLVLRGHRLVADDIVSVHKHPPSLLFGSGSEIIRYHMEIRGLGIINIRDLFGISAVRDRKLIEMVIELHEWDPHAEYERLGIDDQRYNMLDVNLPLIKLPVRPGRNISAIIEVAVRNHLLKMEGHHSAREFQERLSREIMTAENKRQHQAGLFE